MRSRSVHQGGWTRRSCKKTAYVISYIIPLIPLLALVSLLLMRGTGAIVRSERVTLERVGDYAVLNDWLNQFRDDTRSAGEIMTVSVADDGATVVGLQSGDALIEYRVEGSEVTRSRRRNGVSEVTGQWILRGMTITVSNSDECVDGGLLDVVVQWKREHRHRLEDSTLLFETSFYVGRNLGA